METPEGGENDSAKPSDTEIDAMEQFEKQENLSKRNQVLRAILGGFNLTLKLEGIAVRLFTSNVIKR